MLALALVLVLLLAWGMTNPGSSLLVHDLFAHPIFYGLLAWLLLSLGVAGHVEHVQHRVVAAVMLAGVGITCFALAGLVISAQISREHAVTRLVAPAPSRLEAIVDDNGDDTRPVTTVVVQDRSWSLSAHRYEVACVHAEEPGERVTSVTWQDDGSLRLALAGGSALDLPVDDDGSTQTPLRRGILCTR